jgi:mycofactocin system glycosyltransferase
MTDARTDAPTDLDTGLAGLRVVPDAELEVRSGGRVLVGGSPMRVVRLSEAGAAVVGPLLAGAPVPPGPGPTALVRRLLDGGLVHPVPEGGRLRADDVTVVVPVHGALDPAMLDGLGRAGAVVVVDDASPRPVDVPDQTADGVPVRVVRRSAQGGPAAARNTGLAEVETDLVAFVDADCRPRPGWLTGLLPLLADPEVAAVAPRIVAADDRRDAGLLARYEAARSALDMGARPARVRARTRVSFVPAAALVARTAALRAVGGFDEAMLVGEDVDLVWRLDEHGRTVRYQPGASVAHRHRTSPRSWLRRRYDYGTSAAGLARRHPGALAPVEASGWSLAALGLAAVGHPVAGAAVAASSVASLSQTLDQLDDAQAVATRLAARGHLAAARLAADAVVRPYWPVALLVGLVVPSRRLRRALLAAALAGPVVEWVRERPRLDPFSWVALRLLDDAAYGTGVWAGALAERTADPLRPELTRWPRPTRYSAWRAEQLPPPPARGSGPGGGAAR